MSTPSNRKSTGLRSRRLQVECLEDRSTPSFVIAAPTVASIADYAGVTTAIAATPPLLTTPEIADGQSQSAPPAIAPPAEPEPGGSAGIESASVSGAAGQVSAAPASTGPEEADGQSQSAPPTFAPPAEPEPSGSAGIDSASVSGAAGQPGELGTPSLSTTLQGADDLSQSTSPTIAPAVGQNGSAVGESAMVSGAAGQSGELGTPSLSTMLQEADDQSQPAQLTIAPASEVTQNWSAVGESATVSEAVGQPGGPPVLEEVEAPSQTIGAAISPLQPSGVPVAGPTTTVNQGQLGVPAASATFTPTYFVPVNANVAQDAAFAGGFGNSAPIPLETIVAPEHGPAMPFTERIYPPMVLHIDDAKLAEAHVVLSSKIPGEGGEPGTSLPPTVLEKADYQSSAVPAIMGPTDGANLAEAHAAVVVSAKVLEAADEPGTSALPTVLEKANDQSSRSETIGAAISSPPASGVSNPGPTTAVDQGQLREPAASGGFTPPWIVHALNPNDIAFVNANVTAEAAVRGFGDSDPSNQMAQTEAETPALTLRFLQNPLIDLLGGLDVPVRQFLNEEQVLDFPARTSLAQSFDVALREFLDELDESVEQVVDFSPNTSLAPGRLQSFSQQQQWKSRGETCGAFQPKPHWIVIANFAFVNPVCGHDYWTPG